jgi:hypothetical protein
VIIAGLGGAAAGGLTASAFKASSAGIVGGALLDEATKMLKSLLVSERLNQGEHDQDKDKNDRQSKKNWRVFFQGQKLTTHEGIYNFNS